MGLLSLPVPWGFQDNDQYDNDSSNKNTSYSGSDYGYHGIYGTIRRNSERLQLIRQTYNFWNFTFVRRALQEDSKSAMPAKSNTASLGHQ